MSEDTDLIPAIREIKRKFPMKKIYSISINKKNEFIKICDKCYSVFLRPAKKYIQPTEFKASQKLIDYCKDSINKNHC